ncbi:hypothetical protein ACE3KB_06445 [Enterobacter hormaechei subsp. oharae]
MTPLNFQAGFTDQTLQAVFDDTPVTLRLRWNERFGFWSLGIYDRESLPIITGVKLVQNYPLLKNFSFDNFSGDIYCIRTYGEKVRPDIDSIGGDHLLVYATKEEIDEFVSANG